MKEKKTIKEFADELNIDRKKVKNKVDYLKRNGEISADIQSGVSYLSKADQIRVCKALNIPIFYTNSADFQLPVSQLKEQVKDLKSDKEFLKKRLEEQERANSELRILLEKSINQKEQLSLAEKSTENPQTEIAETIDNKELDPVSDVAEKSTEIFSDDIYTEKKFWEVNPNYKGYWHTLVTAKKSGSTWRISQLRARRLRNYYKRAKGN